MAIRGNIGLATVDILASDTTIVLPAAPAERIAISAFSIHNTGASSVTLNFFLSPNTTSAAGKRVAQYTLSGNSSADVVELLGQGLAVGRNVIAVGSGTGCNATVSYTEYTSGD